MRWIAQSRVQYSALSSGERPRENKAQTDLTKIHNAKTQTKRRFHEPLVRFSLPHVITQAQRAKHFTPKSERRAAA